MARLCSSEMGKSTPLLSDSFRECYEGFCRSADKEGEYKEQTVAELSAALPALSTAKAQVQAIRIPRRPMKIGAAATLAFAGLYATFSEHEYVASSRAIVSAYVLDVRAPIDGTISGLPSAAGVPVRAGDRLGRLEDPRVDKEHLASLRAEEMAARSEADGLLEERRALEMQRSGLLARADEHTVAIVSRLEQQVAGAQRVLAADRLAELEARTEMERGRQLHEQGILATAEFDKLLSAQRIAVERTGAEEAELRGIQAQAAAAGHGVLADPAANTDVAYSHQRADELAIRLAENARGVAVSSAHARQAEEQSRAEQTRTSLLDASDLRSPIDGMLWNLNAMDGERAATGDSVLTLVDCRRQFLLVQIPQERVPDVAVRGQARIRLAGEAIERIGTVLSVSPDAQKDVRHKLAMSPEPDQAGEFAMVRIGLDPEAEGGSGACYVGRTARVLIPTTPSNGLSRIMRRYF